MPTPPKPFTVLTNEKKSHRTKAELNQRKQAEELLSTGVTLKEHIEVKKDKVAHSEFIRINKLLKNIGKNDAIYEGVINRYCIMVSECREIEEIQKSIVAELQDMTTRLSNNEIEYIEYIEYKDKLQGKIIAYDKQLQVKRKMLFDIEKENIMTIASALRSIPKKVEKKNNELLKALGGSG